ncbi:MAG TPA: hypothetical protein VF094_04635 [Gaiellaceae bacterium]
MRWRSALLIGALAAVVGAAVAKPAVPNLEHYTYVFRQGKAVLTLTLPAPVAYTPGARACASALHDPLVLIRAVADNRAGRDRFVYPEVIVVGLKSGRVFEYVGLDARITADRWGEKARRLGGGLYDRCAVDLWNDLSVSRVVLPRAQNVYLYAARGKSFRLADVQYAFASDPLNIGPDPVELHRR